MSILQLPTAPELVVVALIGAILFGIPLGVLYVLRRRSTRIEELERRIEVLEADQD